MKLSKALKDRDSFVIIAEMAAGPGFNLTPIENFLKAYKASGASAIPAGFYFVGVTSPQNPGGVPNFQPADVLNRLCQDDLIGSLDFVPHVTCKDQNTDSILADLMAYRRAGIDSILALTGDKPVKGKGVFEVDSIGLLNMIKYINNTAYVSAKPEELDKTFQFFPAAAVSPFKYTEGSLLQQYYKMEKKIASGARFLITQVGWDWKKSLELFTYLRLNNIDIPVIGNVYFLSTTTAAPRLMHDLKLTGCYVSDALLAKLNSETVDRHIERAAQQLAMYKALGSAGADIGGFPDFATFSKILNRAAEIGKDWERFKDNLCWPMENGFYLYDDTGKQSPLQKYPKKFKHRFFNFFHRTILDSDYRGFWVFRKFMSVLGVGKGKGAAFKLFNASEKAFKYVLFDCKECGDCYLPENFGLCTIGGCEKGLDNPPCGDATVDGLCGNDLERECIGELIYKAASSEKQGLEKLKSTINKPRNHTLEYSSSIANYLFAKDHTRKNPIIYIGETIHASIPKTGRIMKQLAALGPDAFTKPSGSLNYIRALIETQVAENADYIAVNLDALGEENPQITVDMIKEYVKLFHKWAGTVPICIDSSNNDCLIAGLKEWYNTDKFVKPPLLNSVKVYTIDKILPLRKHYDFSFIALLIGQEKPTGPGGSHSVEELYSFAQQIYTAAVGKYGFKPDEIFFDSTVFPLAIDMPLQPGVPGYTYRAFETIKKIRSNPKLKHSHCSLGVSNSVRELPGRKIGVCRAYVAKAVEYGLDAAILNTAHRYGFVDPDPELLKLVDAFAKMDGSPDKLNDAMKIMGQFCRSCRKPSI